MADYHWNESPNDFMALLDSSSSIPFDNPFFGLDQDPTVEPAPTTNVLHAPALEENLFCDALPITAANNDISTPPSILDVPNFDIDQPSLPTIATQPSTITSTAAVTAAPALPASQSNIVAVENPTPPSENGSEHDNSGVPPSAAPSTPGASSETLPGGASNSISSAASDVTGGISAVDMARKAAEDFANSKVSERKRRMGRSEDGDDEDAKRRKGLDGSPCSDGDDDAPEKVSHRKYQKRLQKNRDSAYVSRIRRREYTKRLEDGLNRMEKEKIEVQTKYDALQRKFDVIMRELKTMKEATSAKFKAIARPVGAAGRSATKKTSAGAIFMCIIIFGLCLPGTSPWRTDTSSVVPSMGKTNVGEDNIQYIKGPKKGRVWSGMEPVPAPAHWGCIGEQGVMNRISNNVTVVFGPENGGEMMRLLKSRVGEGRVGMKKLAEVEQKSQFLAANLDNEVVKKTLPSRRSKLLKSALTELASVADECFTKELIALLTIRIMPNEGVAKLRK